METTKPKDSEILSNVIEALDSNANKLSTKLGYKSASSVYHILNGENSISTDMARKIVDIYPNINYLYITLGELPVVLDTPTRKGQSNALYSERATFDDVPQTLVDIKELLEKIFEKINSK